MRIDLGSGGKIIGTRKVSPNGQVSGLREFAGQEILVVLPGQGESSEGLPGSYLKGIEEIVQEQVERTLEQYSALQKVYAAPFEAARNLLNEKKPTQERKGK